MSMTVIERLKQSIIVPVVVLDSAADAIPTAKALLSGGVDTMEITFRTACAPEAIRKVTEHCPQMLVGAGTILHLAQAKQAVAMGAKFIVSPGLNEEVILWCKENNIPVIPGCVTPTEIMAAIKLGLNTVKFFPANVYGGLGAMGYLAGVFEDLRFLPTGGVNAGNIQAYMAAPFVHAVGGSWVCPRADIAAGNWAQITKLCKDAQRAAKGE